MAGIGFVLRKLARQDNILGLCQAFTHSALASSGSWLFTILALGAIVAFGEQYTTSAEIQEFRIIVIYNFSFSLVLTAPVFMIATRYLADCIHDEDVSTIPGMLVGALLLVFMFLFPLSVLFYFCYASMPDTLAFSAVTNFMLISAIWLIAIFLTALKDYKTITHTFAIGIVISIAASTWLAREYQSLGMLNGFSMGLGWMVASLLAHVFSEYPSPLKTPFAFLGHFKKYWEVALGGLAYNAGVWVDKWIMWFSPEAEMLPNKLISYPLYDSAMFYAYFTIVPALAIFVFSLETSFFEIYLKFYRDIQRNATFKRIQENHKALINNIMYNARNFLLIQGSLAITIILMSPRIFEAANLNYLQIGIFRYGVLGSFFHILTLFLTILLSYFDYRKGALVVYVMFLVTNTAFSYISMKAGFDYYGYGYFMASLTTFLIAAVITARYAARLPFHTFLTRNASVSAQTQKFI